MPDLLKPDGYVARIAGARLDRALSTAPMVLIEGTKGCGKTWLGLSRSRSKMMLAEDANALSAARTITREVLLDGDRPKLVDEWQRAPEVWDAARAFPTWTPPRASSSSPVPTRGRMPLPATQERVASCVFGFAPCRFTNWAMPPGRYRWPACSRERLLPRSLRRSTPDALRS